MAFAPDSLNLNGSSPNTLINPKFNQGAFEDLPPEITIDILSRLPIRTIANCKLVSKPWRNLIDSRDFTNFHHSNSAAGLVLLAGPGLIRCKLFETGLDRHDLGYNLVTEFNLPFSGLFFHLCGSASGLTFMCDPGGFTADIYFCNPLTREYVKLVYPHEDDSCNEYGPLVAYGFGASKTGKHKLVRITHDPSYERMAAAVGKWECQIYTLGTGLWRSIEAEGAQLYFKGSNPGVFVNGNLHWLARNSIGSPLVSCFDLETELFSTFSLPTIPLNHFGSYTHPFASGDCLGLWDSNDGIVIWLMKQYRDERSWAKEFVISINPDLFLYDIGFPPELCDDELYADDPCAGEPNADELYVAEPNADEFYVAEPNADEPNGDELCWNEFFGHELYAHKPVAVYPIKISEDGDILMSWCEVFVLRYSSKTKAIKRMPMFKQGIYADYTPILHTPSFVSLKRSCFEGCNVISF